ncbi:CAP domain-containing protein [Halalkalibacter sp. AB-rgal2]|uniref:CAP domain-containing protein n=1 Tax=Halalkalibacter sp. AB-rgal2 TaxID=3242695 RepID=UPI00359DD4B9
MRTTQKEGNAKRLSMVIVTIIVLLTGGTLVLSMISQANGEPLSATNHNEKLSVKSLNAELLLVELKAEEQRLAEEERKREEEERAAEEERLAEMARQEEENRLEEQERESAPDPEPVEEREEEVFVVTDEPKEHVANSPASEKQDTEVEEQPEVKERASNQDFERQVVALTNEERKKHGLADLEIDNKLMDAARMKSNDMQTNDYFAHESPTYGSPSEMKQHYGIDFRASGENIAHGYSSPEAVVNGWMNSEGHRQNILREEYTHIGVGYDGAGHYWTQMFVGR